MADILPPAQGEPDPSGAPDVTENDDGSVTVQVATPADDLPEEAFNLVTYLQETEEGKKVLKKCADQAVSDTDDDWESCGDWRKKRRDRWRLTVGDLDPKSYPFEDCANVHIPVMLERTLRIVHRLYAEMFPDRDYVFSVLPSSALSQDRADVLSLHENWQIRKEIPDFFKQNRRALFEFVTNGDCVMYSYRDIPGKRNRHEALSCEDFVFPYHWRTSMVDCSDIPRKTRMLRKFKHEMLELEAQGIWANTDQIIEAEKNGPLYSKAKPAATTALAKPKGGSASFEDGPDLTVRPAVDKFEGRDAPTSGGAAPYVFYEHHCWYKMPGWERERPVTITVEPKSKTVVCISLREQEDWKDRLRFDKQTQEHGAFEQLQRQHQQLQAMEQQTQEALAQPHVPPDEAQMLQQQLAQSAPLPPAVPSWLKPGMAGPDPVRKVPIESFSHGVCIENLDGSLGLGIGLLLEPFNKTANTVASQFIDSATLANVATVICPANVMEGMEGEVRLTPGEFHPVRGVSAEQIQNAFKVIQFPQANPQLMTMVEMQLKSADGVSSAPEVLSGEAGKANETYRGLATRVEQATKQLTVMALNYLEMLSNVLRNNARLNAVFMDDEELKRVVDPRTMEGKSIKISRALYAEDYDIAFTADTRFAGRAQKISEADQVVGMVGSLPPPVAMQMFPPSFIYEAIVRALKARGLHDMVPQLGPRPQPPQFAAGEKPPAPPPGMGPPGMPGMSPGGPPPPNGGPPSPGAPIQGPRAAPVQQ